MRIVVEADKCIGGGQCVLASPDVFDQDDDGIVVVLEERPTRDSEESVKDAIEVCPARAIQLVQE